MRKQNTSLGIKKTRLSPGLFNECQLSLLNSNLLHGVLLHFCETNCEHAVL